MVEAQRMRRPEDVNLQQQTQQAEAQRQQQQQQQSISMMIPVRTVVQRAAEAPRASQDERFASAVVGTTASDMIASIQRYHPDVVAQLRETQLYAMFGPGSGNPRAASREQEARG